MKNPDNDIDKKIRETLSSLDDVKKASPGPFFYTRLKARMEGEQERPRSAFTLQPVYQRIAIIVLSVLVLANIYTASQFLGNTSAPTTSTTTNEEAFVNEYYPATTTVYNLEQNITQ